MDATPAPPSTHVPEPEPAPEPSSEAAPPSSLESRSERRHRHGRRARLYVWAVLLIALVAVLIVLTSRNTRVARLDWVFGSTNASLAWIVLAAAVLGWLLGIVTSIAFQHQTRRPR